MKLKPNSTQPQIFNEYQHPWYEHNEKLDQNITLVKPNPPSEEAVERAKFVDKTYEWSGSSSVRSGDKRTDS